MICNPFKIGIEGPERITPKSVSDALSKLIDAKKQSRTNEKLST